jgi:hypothetical protein
MRTQLEHNVAATSLFSRFRATSLNTDSHDSHLSQQVNMSANGDRDEAIQAYQQSQSNSTDRSDQTITTATDEVATALREQHSAFPTPQNEASAYAAAAFDVQEDSDDVLATPSEKCRAQSMQPRLAPASINRVNSQIHANAKDNLQYAISQRERGV